MIIYRVREKEVNVGPYHASRDDWEWRKSLPGHWIYCDEESNGFLHKTPFFDGIDDFSSDEFCALTEEQLPKWFSKEEVDTLLLNDFILVKIEIEEKFVTFGGAQVVYDDRKKINEYILNRNEIEELYK